MYALLSVVIKEFLQLRQDKKMIPVMIVGPLAQLLALGYAATLDVNNVPIVLVDQDRTAESRGLVERFTGSGCLWTAGPSLRSSSRPATATPPRRATAPACS